jgi:hypothetical protein
MVKTRLSWLVLTLGAWSLLGAGLRNGKQREQQDTEVTPHVFSPLFGL